MLRLRPIVISSLALLCLFGLWWLAGALHWASAFLLPPPAKVWATFLSLCQSGKLQSHMLVSLGRVGGGFALALVSALVISIFVSNSKIFAAIIEPPLEFLRQLPPLALIPLMLLWLGIGEAQKLGIIVMASFFPIYLGFRGGFAQVDPKLIEVGRAAGFTRLALLRRIALPAALPSIITGLRLGLGYGWRALVGAELIASSAGLGYLILDAQDLARTDIVLVGVFVIGIIGVLTDNCLKALVRWRLPWIAQDLELGHG